MRATTASMLLSSGLWLVLRTRTTDLAPASRRSTIDASVGCSSASMILKATGLNCARSSVGVGTPSRAKRSSGARSTLLPATFRACSSSGAYALPRSMARFRLASSSERTMRSAVVLRSPSLLMTPCTSCCSAASLPLMGLTAEETSSGLAKVARRASRSALSRLRSSCVALSAAAARSPSVFRALSPVDISAPSAFNVESSRSMRCVPERAVCPASVAEVSRVSISRATLLRRASS